MAYSFNDLSEEHSSTNKDEIYDYHFAQTKSRVYI